MEALVDEGQKVREVVHRRRDVIGRQPIGDYSMRIEAVRVGTLR